MATSKNNEDVLQTNRIELYAKTRAITNRIPLGILFLVRRIVVQQLSFSRLTTTPTSCAIFFVKKDKYF